MTTCNPPSNPLLVNYFQFILDRVPNMVYFCQSVNLPGIGFGVADQPTVLGHPVKVPTGAFRFEDIELTFRVDENMTNWREIYNWIYTTGNYISDAATLPHGKKTSDATLLVTNSAFVPKYKVHFKNVFPVYLGGIEFSVNTPTSTEVVCEAKFTHTGYEIEHI